MGNINSTATLTMLLNAALSRSIAAVAVERRWKKETRRKETESERDTQLLVIYSHNVAVWTIKSALNLESYEGRKGVRRGEEGSALEQSCFL